jgi:Zn-dependent peptidase ImmA (M78 family)/DNA-binding XRE family transcriptional regulator
VADSFNASRLSLARRRRGLKKTDLARKLGVELRTITAWEREEFEPSEDSLRGLASILRFPLAFFCGADLAEALPDTASFRSMKRMTASVRNMALGAGSIALLLNSWLEERFELPAADIPDLSKHDTPEAAAQALRNLWGLGELPIKNTVHLLESRGVRAYTLAIDAAEVDAFSMWQGTTPFIFLNTKKSCEHSRFDAAHELGHLVLHRQGVPQGQEAEAEANAFASAFLMPRASVLSIAPRFPTIDTLIELKKYWTVSVAALAYRLQSIGVLSEWHYRNLAIEIAMRGYRKKEPNEAPRESSQLLAKVFAALRQEGLGKEQIAEALKVPADEINQLVFGLAMTGVRGSEAPGASSKSPAKLRLVS